MSGTIQDDKAVDREGSDDCRIHSFYNIINSYEKESNG